MGHFFYECQGYSWSLTFNHTRFHLSYSVRDSGISDISCEQLVHVLLTRCCNWTAYHRRRKVPLVFLWGVFLYFDSWIHWARFSTTDSLQLFEPPESASGAVFVIFWSPSTQILPLRFTVTFMYIMLNLNKVPVIY